MERIAITGPPLSGKSTLIEALAHRSDKGAGGHTVYSYEDPILSRLASAENSSKLTPVKIAFEEVPLSSTGDLRQVDCIVAVTRPGIASKKGDLTESSIAAIEDVLAELILADLGVVEGALERLRKVAATGDLAARSALEPAEQLIRALSSQDLKAAASIAAGSTSIPKDWGLLCAKPVLAVINVEEEAAQQARSVEESVKIRLDGAISTAIASPLQVEAELSQLDPRDAVEIARSFLIEELVASRLARSVLDALDLIVFYTANEKEARAWTLKRGSTALQAAGKIHSDMERGFIRAEVIPAEELLVCGSLKEARKEGKVRVEGKGYIVQPSDVLWIRFNV